MKQFEKQFIMLSTSEVTISQYVQESAEYPKLLAFYFTLNHILVN